MLRVSDSLAIDESELDERFVRASGPGGQNVNKVATAVQLRFDVRRSPSLPDDVRQRLLAMAASKVTADGVLVIDARRHRTQAQNRDDARERLAELVRRASVVPRVRRRTKPTARARAQRIESKRQRAQIKRGRGKVVKEE